MTLVGIRAPRASKSSPGSTCWITSLPCATRQTFRNAPSQTFRNPHLVGPRLLDLGVPEATAAVGIVVGGGFGPHQRLAQQRRVRQGGVVYELVAADTAEVGRARRFARHLALTNGAAPT
jgi:hypothetical protein